MLVGILPLAWVSFAQPASLTLSALTKPGDVVMDLKSVVMKQIE
jgi:hypothetical protein